MNGGQGMADDIVQILADTFAFSNFRQARHLLLRTPFPFFVLYALAVDNAGNSDADAGHRADDKIKNKIKLKKITGSSQRQYR